jgi:small subunit ribosomal protein S20
LGFGHTRSHEDWDFVATHASTEKRLRQNTRLRDRNRQLRSELRSALKSARRAIEAGGASDLGDRLQTTQALIDRMVTKGIIHRNTAARYKSRLTRAAAQASPAA